MIDDDEDLTAAAALFALDALDDVERARLLRTVAQAPPARREEFDAEVAEVREALAGLSRATAAEPPAALRGRLLAQIDDEPVASAPSRRRRPGWMLAAAAAAAVVVGVGGVAIGYAIGDRDAPGRQSSVEEIFAAPDVQTTSGEVAGGRATVTYSPSTGEGVLVMNQVPKPAPGTIYQMWLDGPGGPRLAGTMTDADIGSSTTAVIEGMRGATAVSFTVGDAATPEQRIGEPVATLPLT
ncbi:anti-sigma-K factor RskA [Gordonia hirsuta DSM 44140 = NBRC 16056]|uniref:Regulator of SigK n=1 Tax=Gordonia hirsuta DSM 44140 = NBRC 16056 TaxID=1121927 RepID=L7LBE4_9ACTN|nr:anti-sigma factor [Gordonia hirsuta]GAC58041.1 anti-sigma-K factor RskA [Gordonia hirsuta DSM 44140 = NBRC 16056]